MPTGYTCKVQDGSVVELKDYILNCARQFGALVHMREDGKNAEIRYREVSDYHLNELNKAYARLEEIKKMTDKEIQRKIDQNYEENIKSIDRMLKNKEDSKKKYLAMIEKVNEWIPPTENHENLKEFAIKQLQDSIKWDCDCTYLKQEIRKETVSEYREGMIKYCLRDIEYHSSSYKKELEAAEEGNKWIDDLINSLN
ncbi:hypothetical protein H9L25_00585 [Terrisporobacter mayombei]|nr:hypothetical protein [Terrisporobacter mayombei]